MLERAIYMDFEGNENRDSTFVGLLVEDTFEQIVTEEEMRAAAAHTRPARLHRPPAGYRPLSTHRVRPARIRVGTLTDVIDEVLARATAENRVVIGWSSYEKSVLIRVAPQRSSMLESAFVDGKAVAKRWKRHAHPKSPLPRTPFAGRHRLKNYFKLIEYRLPAYFGERQAAARISFVRNGLATRGGDFDALTPTTKAKWTKVLDYNWHDCNGLRELMLHVAAASEP